jgi:hypothetical protein
MPEDWIFCKRQGDLAEKLPQPPVGWMQEQAREGRISAFRVYAIGH